MPFGVLFPKCVTRSLKWIQNWEKDWSLVPCQTSGTLLPENTGRFTTWGLKNIPRQKNIIILLSTCHHQGRETHSFCILNRLRSIHATFGVKQHKQSGDTKKKVRKKNPLYWSAVYRHHVCESVCILKLACPLLYTHKISLDWNLCSFFINIVIRPLHAWTVIGKFWRLSLQ